MDAPQASWRPPVAAACALAAVTAVCFLSVPGLVAEQIVASEWHPQIERVIGQDVPRKQYLNPELARGVYPVPTWVSSYIPQSNLPVFDVKRQQYLYPSLDYTENVFAETIYGDKWHLAIQRPVFVQGRTQYLSAGIFYADIPRIIVFADKWHPEIPRPVFDVRRTQQTYPEQAFAPYPVPAPVSGWQPQTNQPQFDQKRLQYFYPAESRDDVAGKELVSADRWQGVNPPLYDGRRLQAIYPAESRDDIAGRERVSPDKWQPLTNQPLFDQKRLQYLYPVESRDDIAGLEKMKADEWHPAIVQPLFDARRQQAGYPSLAYADVPRTETIKVDEWQPLGNQPRFDQKRLQAIYPAESRNDIAGRERVSPDKWHLEIPRPVFDVRRTQQSYPEQALAPVPIPPPVTAWQPLPNQPQFDQKRLQALYPFESRVDIAGKETIKTDEWQPLTNQPFFVQKRQTWTYQDAALNPYLVPAPASGWQPLTNQPLVDLKRLQYLYPSEFRGDVPRTETIYADKWQGVNPPLYDVRRLQALYPFESRVDIAGKETIKTDEWQPLTNQPLFAVKRQTWTYQDAALNPYLVPPQTSGWQPLGNQPLFDLKRLQYLYPSEFRGDVPRTETINGDKWHLEIQRPVFDLKRAQFTYEPSALSPYPVPPAVSGWQPLTNQPLFAPKRQQQTYPDQILRSLPITPFVSGWQPAPNQPVFDYKRTQYLAAGLFYADIPRIETLYERSLSGIEQPLYAVRRQQYLYPSLATDTLPRKETVSIDRWHPRIERVLYDARSSYRITNELAYADIPRNLLIGPDRWGGSAEMPVRLAPRPDPAMVQAFLSIPPPVATWVDGQVAQIPVLPRLRPFDTPSGLGDRPRKETIFVDRWWAEISQPSFSRLSLYRLPDDNYTAERFIAAIAPPGSRLQTIAPEVRTFLMFPESRFAVAGLPGGPSMQQYTHSPNEILDYGWDWSSWVEAIGDSIATSTWIVPAGILQTNSSIVAGTSITSVFLQGNKPGAVYTCTNRIVTAGGRTAEQSFKLTIGTV